MVSIDNNLSHNRLKEHIITEIEISKNLCISFARFMEMALYTPRLGYYQTNRRILGQQGDFTTAPEISSWFSCCIANYCVPILHSLSSHTSVVMEIGPGTGRMAADILLALEKLNCLPSRYVLVEISDYLREQQQLYLAHRVPHLADRIEYRSALPTEAFEGIILANEVIDALPVHRFGIEHNNLHEYCVGYEQEQFVWRKTIPSTSLRECLEHIQQTYLSEANHYTSEVHLSLIDWFNSVQACLSKGGMIFIDYGKAAQEYYHPRRYTGTLRCYYQHHLNDEPLQRVGLQDITSEVDFTQLANLAMHANLQLEAFTTQSAFLLATGLLDSFKLQHSQARYLSTKGKVHQLTSPLEMGESCKVMIFKRKLCCNLLSLEEYDKRFTL